MGYWENLIAGITIANQQGNTALANLGAGLAYQHQQSNESSSTIGSAVNSITNAVSNPATIGAVIGSVVAPGIGSGLGAEAGAALGGAAGQASTGDTDLQHLATVAAFSGAGAGLGGMFGSSAASSAASGLTALGAGAGASYGASILTQDEVNADAGPVEQTPGTPATGPGFSDIMKTDAQQEQENIQRRQQRLASGRKGTILTGTRGTNNSTGNYQRKTLLGS